MNDNPIICDPGSEEANTLLNQNCEFSNSYYALKQDDYSFIIKGSLHINGYNRPKPFFCRETQEFYTFIREIKKT